LVRGQRLLLLMVGKGLQVMLLLLLLVVVVLLSVLW
jgi:hypothetical protein